LAWECACCEVAIESLEACGHRSRMCLAQLFIRLSSRYGGQSIWRSSDMRREDTAPSGLTCRFEVKAGDVPAMDGMILHGHSKGPLCSVIVSANNGSERASIPPRGPKRGVDVAMNADRGHTTRRSLFGEKHGA